MKRVAAVALAIGTLVIGIGSASAEWSGSAGVEYFNWKESITPTVKETGPRVALGLNWTQNKEAGWLAAYRLKVYKGNVDYEGAFLFTGTPVSSRTHYFGYTNEIQGIYRTADRSFEFVSGLGWDSWQRNLSPQQEEDYDIYYVRLGININTRTKQGFFGGGGAKFPIYTTEDAHLQSIGADQNPRLHPGRDLSLYGELGYRINPKWDLIGYYDSFRFRQSNVVTVSANAIAPGASFIVFQPQSRMDIVGLKIQYTF